MADTFDSATRTLISSARLNRKTGKRVYWTIVILTIVVFSVAFLGPLYWMVSGGLKTGKEIAQVPPTLYPKTPTITNYSNAWRDLTLGRLILNTLIYAVGALGFQLVFCVTAAFAFSKLKPAGHKVILGMMLGTLMIPSTVLIIPQYVTVISLPIFHWNLLDTPWAIWLPAVTNAFNIFLLKRFFDSIPDDLMSAAAMDGAGPLRTLWSIILPMSRPILGVIAIFSTTAIWKDFLWPKLVEPSAGTRTVNVGLYAFAQGLTQQEIVAGSVIAAIPTIVVFLIFQKNIMSGLTTGSLKG